MWSGVGVQAGALVLLLDLGNEPLRVLFMINYGMEYFGHLMWRAVSMEKALMMGKVEGRRRKGRERMR